MHAAINFRAESKSNREQSLDVLPVHRLAQRLLPVLQTLEHHACGPCPELPVDRLRGEWFDTAVNLLDRITVEPGKCGGRPCIRGFRIRVKDILEMLADGATKEEILADFPDLEADDIRAALLYAAGGSDRVVMKAA